MRRGGRFTASARRSAGANRGNGPIAGPVRWVTPATVKASMETIDAYLDRKADELALLDACLAMPSRPTRPRSVAQVIRDKFKLTARLKADHALSHWAETETAWADPGQPRSGPFQFSYDYQRADLGVRGPSFYEVDAAVAAETVYAASGMAALAALLLASARTIGPADLVALPGTYGESLELIEGHARHLRLAPVTRSIDDAVATTAPRRLMLLDACAPAALFEATFHGRRPAFDLLIFDTTCLWAGSARIRRVLDWACQADIPVVMVRSHTKLDSLGAEYGRLGSAVFIDWPMHSLQPGASRLTGLQTEMRNAVRLLGGAALPAHFPPFVGSPRYRDLTRRRMAAILRNTRRAARHFAAALPGLTEELRFAHGLYLTLKSSQPLDETTARNAAAAMSEDLAAAGNPIRHAGSFGFDFAATEWFHSAATDRYSVRVAVPDLPTELWDELVVAIARWWSSHHGGARRDVAARPSPALELWARA